MYDKLTQRGAPGVLIGKLWRGLGPPNGGILHLQQPASHLPNNRFEKQSLLRLDTSQFK
jgi:hypothetical protein